MYWDEKYYKFNLWGDGDGRNVRCRAEKDDEIGKRIERDIDLSLEEVFIFQEKGYVKTFLKDFSRILWTHPCPLRHVIKKHRKMYFNWETRLGDSIAIYVFFSRFLFPQFSKWKLTEVLT